MPTGLVRIPLLLITGGVRLGLDRAELLAVARLGDQQVSDPDARIPVDSIVRLWRHIIERRPDPELGVRLGEQAAVREYGLVGYAMLHSPNVFEALRRLARYSRILNEDTSFTLERTGDGLTLELRGSPALDSLRHPIDARLATTLTALREIAGNDLAPLEVRFAYPDPGIVTERRRVFRAPLRFAQRSSTLVLRAADAQRPITGADATLRGYLDRLAEETLESLGDRSSFADRVRRAVWDELSGGQPTLERIATVMGVSTRTLQRRLHEEGTSYGKLLDDLRHRAAAGLLRNRTLAVYEVAFLLGYSDPSAFHRAFRRWMRTSPREYRRSSSTP